MSNQDNGGPAFPVSHSPSYPNEIVGGMTLRDYFAAKAMDEFISMFPTEIWNDAFKMGTGTYAQQVAQVAYHMADAMLAAREAA